MGGPEHTGAADGAASQQGKRSCLITHHPNPAKQTMIDEDHAQLSESPEQESLLTHLLRPPLSDGRSQPVLPLLPWPFLPLSAPEIGSAFRPSLSRPFHRDLPPRKRDERTESLYRSALVGGPELHTLRVLAGAHNKLVAQRALSLNGCVDCTGRLDLLSNAPRSSEGSQRAERPCWTARI